MHADEPPRARPAAGGAASSSATAPAPPQHQQQQHDNHAYRPQQLSAAAGDLAALLRRGQATLDALSARLEAEYAARFCGASFSSSGPVDPCALAQRARRLERELPALRAEAEAAAAARRALAERAAAMLGSSRARLHELSVRAGLGPPRDQREGGAFDAAVRAAGEAAAAVAAAAASRAQAQASSAASAGTVVVGR